MRADEFATRVRGAQQHGDDWRGFCQAHDDRDKRSLSFRDKDGKVLVKCFAGCTPDAIVSAFGITMKDLFHDNEASEKDSSRRIERTYDYHDENGVLLYQVVRFAPKSFQQRQPDGKGGWNWSMKDARRVLYNLRNILASVEKWVIVHEGEKAVEAATAAGLPGVHTTTAGGASNWKHTDLSSLKGRNVVICPDHDTPGETYANGIAGHLKDIAAMVKIVRWPGVPEHGDCVEWLAGGGTPDTFQTLCDAAPLYTPRQGSVSEASSKPELDCDEGDLDKLTTSAWAILKHVNNPPSLYKRGSGLVRVEEDPRGVVLAELTDAKCRYEVAHLTRCTKTKVTIYGGGKREDCKPPVELIKNLLATPPQGIPLPELHGVIGVPVLSPSGRIVQDPGYDEESKLLYQPYDPTIHFSIPIKPTPADVEQARALIDDLFTDFPFTSEADKCVAIGLKILPFVRQYIKGPTPMHMMEAPQAGSGKGLAVNAALYPAVGTNIGALADARDDDEMRKRLTARLLEGCPVTLLDNITRPLNSATLAAALTANQWEDRRLGKTETIRIPVTTIWVATANNPTMTLELARRTVRCRLDPQIDRPWQRNGWRHPNLLEWVREQRANLVTACLTLVQAWLDAGEPPPDAPPLGSFEDWRRVIGGIVQHAGYKDFLGNVADLYEIADSDGATWRTFTALWWQAHRDHPVTVNDLFSIARDLDGLNLGKSDSERGQRTALGSQLRKRKDQVIGAYRIESGGTRDNAARWCLREVSPLSQLMRNSVQEDAEEEVIYVG